MAAGWIEAITGSLADKKKYRQYKARVAALPESHRAALEAIDRYLMYAGGIAKGDVLVQMLEDLVDLFDQAAADGTPVREIVGEDPVEFVETFLRNYSDDAWIAKERTRLISAIDQATGSDGGAAR